MEKKIENGHVRQMNESNGELSGNWYPKSRPLLHYRQKGKTTNVLAELDDSYWLHNGEMIHVVFNTFWLENYGYVALSQTEPVSFEIDGRVYTLTTSTATLQTVVWKPLSGAAIVWERLTPSERTECVPPPTYGKALKLLGKNSDLCPASGTLSSFSGRAALRPATTLFSKKYFSETSQYLKSRGNSYQVNTVLSQIPGVQYVSGQKVVWPEQVQEVNGEVLNSSLYESCATAATCNRTVYKPNNSKFATQGAVSASARLVRLRHDVKVVRTNVAGKKI